jgi:hypothetical protein
LLDWLGDLGGLFDALKIICNWFVSPVASYALQASLLTKFFLLKPSDSDENLQKENNGRSKKYQE